MANNMIKKIAKTKFMRNIAEKKGTIVNDNNKCVYCGKCQTICPVEAISIERKEKDWATDHGICVRCEKCVKVCPKQALTCEK